MKMSYMLCVLLGSSAYGQVFTCNTQRQNWPSDIIMINHDASDSLFICFNHTAFTLSKVY